MWSFQHIELGALPLRMQRGLRRLVVYAYKKDKREAPRLFTVHVAFTDDSPGDAWVNIIDLDREWNMTYSVNWRNHTIKLKSSDEKVDIGTSKFDDLLEEVTDFVNSSVEEQNAQIAADLEAARQKRKAEQQAARTSQASRALHRVKYEPRSEGVRVASNSKRVKLESARTEQYIPVTGILSQGSTSAVAQVKHEDCIDLTGCYQTPPRRRTQKAQPGASTEQNTEVNSSRQQQPTALCPCGAPAYKSCKAPGCPERYCRQCLNHLDAAKAFQPCDWLCCGGRTLYCPKHWEGAQFVVKCSVCKHMWCKDKNPQCDLCKQAVCVHCLDEHQQNACPSMKGSQSNAAALQNPLPIVC